MSVRDNVLPPLDAARAVIAGLGLRRFSVTLRRRVWSGATIGAGTPTNFDIVLTPTPKVRFKSPFARQMEAIFAAGGKIEDRYFLIDKITPFYNVNGVTGGYTPDQLQMKVGPDLQNVEPIVVLVGDDGLAKECTQVLFEEDRAFGHSMVVQETNRPSVRLVSLAITPNPAALTRPATLQMVAQGTFSDGNQYPVTPLVKWTSSAAGVATINVLGVAAGVSPGTSNIGASIGTIAAPVSVLTVS